jgi:hypothetical protein
MRVHILPSLGKGRLGAIGRLEVEGWIAELLMKGVSPATVNSAHRVLRLVLQTAFEAGIIGRNPAAGIKAQKTKREEMLFLTLRRL